MAVGLVLACAVFGTDIGLAQAAGVTAALPGPPPGAGTGFPLPPAPAESPSPEPLGAPATIPFSPSGPGLLSGSAGRAAGASAADRLPGRRAGGAEPAGSSDRHRGTGEVQVRRRTEHVSFSLDKRVAGQITRSGSVLAGVAFKQGGATEHLSVIVGRGPRLPSSGRACSD